jgi:hypothetical protein
MSIGYYLPVLFVFETDLSTDCALMRLKSAILKRREF